MKAQVPLPDSARNAASTCQGAFTLPELIISMTVFLLLVTGIITAHLFGLRMSRLTENKLMASNGARDALGKMADEIRNCTATWVGNVSNGNFVALLDGVPQTGSGLLIQPTTNAANFIVYFANSSDQSFRRTTSSAGTTTILARAVTNTTVFRAQDCLGNVLTNRQNNRVVHLSLEFYQPQALLPSADYFKVETSVTRRSLQ